MEATVFTICSEHSTFLNIYNLHFWEHMGHLFDVYVHDSLHVFNAKGNHSIRLPFHAPSSDLQFYISVFLQPTSTLHLIYIYSYIFGWWVGWLVAVGWRLNKWRCLWLRWKMSSTPVQESILIYIKHIRTQIQSAKIQLNTNFSCSKLLLKQQENNNNKSY